MFSNQRGGSEWRNPVLRISSDQARANACISWSDGLTSWIPSPARRSFSSRSDSASAAASSVGAVLSGVVVSGAVVPGVSPTAALASTQNGAPTPTSCS